MQLVIFDETGAEHGETLYVVPVEMRQKKDGINRHFVEESVSELAKAASGVQYYQPFTTSDLNAGRVAAEADRSGPRGGNGAADSPETDQESVAHIYLLTRRMWGVSRTVEHDPALIPSTTLNRFLSCILIRSEWMNSKTAY